MRTACCVSALALMTAAVSVTSDLKRCSARFAST